MQNKTNEIDALYFIAQAAWLSMDYPVVAAFLGYVEPVVIPFGIILNILNIIILSKRMTSLGETVQAYYLAIAILDLTYVILHHLFLCFLDYGLGILTSRTFWFGLVDTSRAFCIFERVIAHSCITATSWLYVCLAAERIYAISFPLQARQVLRKRVAVSMIVLLLVIAAGIQGFVMYNFDQVPMGPGQTFCYLVSSGALALAQACALMLAGFCVPAPLTAVLAFVLLVKMRFAMAARNQLTSEKDAGVSIKELSGCITVVILSLIHVITYTSQGYTFIASIVDVHNPNWNRAELIFAVLSSATTCANFFVYYFRLPGFKERLLCREQMSDDEVIRRMDNRQSPSHSKKPHHETRFNSDRQIQLF